jgi:hypothetical protein
MVTDVSMGRSFSCFRLKSPVIVYDQPFDAGIKSLSATLPDEIFTGDFAS